MGLHHEKVKSLSEQSKKLVDGGHFDAASISKKAAELESRLVYIDVDPCGAVLLFKTMKGHCYKSQ